MYNTFSSEKCYVLDFTKWIRTEEIRVFATSKIINMHKTKIRPLNMINDKKGRYKIIAISRAHPEICYFVGYT